MLHVHEDTSCDEAFSETPTDADPQGNSRSSY